jgi:hypothetical protein
MMMNHAMMSHAMMNNAMMTQAQMMMAANNPYMNPLHPLNPVSHSFNVQHDYITPNGMMSIPEGQTDNGDMGFSAPTIHVKTKCNTVKSQALEIANKMMAKQNHYVFKRLMDYLLKSKYLIGMTEIKMTRKLRRNLFNIMKGFSDINHDNVVFVSGHPHLEDRSIESGSIQSLNSSEISSPHVNPDEPHEQMEHLEQDLD